MVTSKELIARLATQSQVSSFFSDYMGIQNVKSYGAAGDGVTVDSTKIQDCITAVIAAGGKTVYFPPGVYLSTTLSNTSSVNFFGDNASFSGISNTIDEFSNPRTIIEPANTTATLPNTYKDTYPSNGSLATRENFNNMVDHTVSITRDASDMITTIEVLVNTTTRRELYTLSRSTVAGSSHLVTSIQSDLYALTSTEIDISAVDTITRDSSGYITSIARVVTT